MAFRPLPLALFATLALVASASTAAAQTSAPAADGCTQADPCPLDLGVDDHGFTDVSVDVVTAGDWYAVGVTNEGEVAHTVTLSGTSLSLTVAVDDVQQQVVQLNGPACLAFKDEPSGATHTLRVVAGDSVDYEQGATSGDPCAKGSPAPAAPLLGVGLVGLAALVRRRA